VITLAATSRYERGTEASCSGKSVENKRFRRVLTTFAERWFTDIVGYKLVLPNIA
jgi:hypothetical protein